MKEEGNVDGLRRTRKGEVWLIGGPMASFDGPIDKKFPRSVRIGSQTSNDSRNLGAETERRKAPPGIRSP